MDKKIVFIIAFVVSLTMVNVSLTMAQVVLVNPLGATDTICKLLVGHGNFPGIIGAVAGLVGAVSVIMIIVAGIMFLLSAGNPERINKAKTASIYAIAGMVIAISAEAIALAIKGVIGAAGGVC